MFVAATRNFVEEVDVGGSLIPVSSPNDPISVLSVVVKRKRLWFWQKPKYIPTDFKLNDILTGDPPINPGTRLLPDSGCSYKTEIIQMFFLFADVTETNFIRYAGTHGDHIQGNVGANFSRLHLQTGVVLEGKDSSKLQTFFGSLKKEEVEMQKLLRDCKDRLAKKLQTWNHLISTLRVRPVTSRQEAFVYNVVF